MNICTGNEFVERRKYPRYDVENGSLVAFKHYAPKLGQIIDMSLGGLAFRYIENREKNTSSELSEIDILVPEEGFYLKQIPIKSLIDIEITNEIPFSTSTMWQHCVQFDTLSLNQQTHLEFFINKYTQNKYSENNSPYYVKNKKNKTVGVSILEFYFGNLWQFTMDRLDHQIDGYISTIQYQGNKYKIYRRLRSFDTFSPALRVVNY